ELHDVTARAVLDLEVLEAEAGGLQDERTHRGHTRAVTEDDLVFGVGVRRAGRGTDSEDVRSRAERRGERERGRRRPGCGEEEQDDLSHERPPEWTTRSEHPYQCRR